MSIITSSTRRRGRRLVAATLLASAATIGTSCSIPPLPSQNKSSHRCRRRALVRRHGEWVFYNVGDRIYGSYGNYIICGSDGKFH